MRKSIIIEIEKLTINCITHDTYYDGKWINLTRQEQKLLELLASRNTFITPEILQDSMGFYSGIRVYINKLRNKLGQVSGGKNFIDTAWTFGYKLCHPNLVKYIFKSSEGDKK